MLKIISLVVVVIAGALFTKFLVPKGGTTFWGREPSKILSIQLSESTRGTFRTIVVTSKNRTISINSEQQVLPTKPNDWKRLLTEAGKLSIQELDQIEVVSKRHQVDAALHATLTLETTEGTFTTPTFDHNAPPEELIAVITCLYGQIPPKMRDRFQ